MLFRSDPEHFLDWDKTLKEHPSIIREKLGWTPDLEKKYWAAESADTDSLLAALQGDVSYSPVKIPVPAGLPPLSAKGSDIARGSSVFDRASDVDKANRLKELGIPGIKYLDAVSRGVGEGSRNYVVFDPEIIEIMRRYAKGGAVEDALHLAKYPMRDRKDWNISHDYESRGGDMTEIGRAHV